jgi:Fe-S oxidoreductase/nitrate reductase gamma subunit
MTSPPDARMLATATRLVQWDVTPLMLWFMYASMAVALGIFAYGVWRRCRIWRLGKSVRRSDQPGMRLSRVLVRGLGHTDMLKERIPGMMHALIFAGFGVLFAATVVVFVHYDLGIPIMRGAFYLYFQSFTVDLFGLLTMIGAGIAAWRRYVARVPHLEHGRYVDALLLAALAVLLATGFLLQGLRIAATGDPWGRWAPAGYLLALAIRALPVGSASLRGAYQGLWLLHVALWHAFLAAIPFTKMLHVVTSPLNIYFGNLDEARGTVPPAAFDKEPAVLGIRSPLDMTWKQLLDLDACTECGRCQAVCPTWAEGKPLSPKRVILDLRDHIRAHAVPLVRAKTALDRGDTQGSTTILDRLPPLAGGVIREETLWACTTCRACEEACPVAIEHVPLILQLRQHLAMEQAQMPAGVGEAIAGLETRHHPFHGALDRREWYQDLPVPEMASIDASNRPEVLYWVGCAAAADERVARVARALVRVMTTAGVRFAVLGPEERCCGDPARRTGNDYHYDILARTNIETLNRYRVKTIVTHCPHCLQTLRHDYAQIGGAYQVVHHTELVQRLLAEGRLRLPRSLADVVTFHDPCYLGRYNGVFEAPRHVLDRVGVDRREMPRAGSRSFCCGAGGGHAFFEDGSGGRIDRNRAREAIATGAETVCTGCPFCLSMLEEAVRGVQGAQGTVRVRDVVEVVAEALGKTE